VAKPFNRFNGHSREVTSVAFTPDESRLISGSADGTLILRDVASGEALRTFSEHSAYINEVALSPDGQLAYTSANNGTVIVRPIAEYSVEEILAHIADNRILHDFTCLDRSSTASFPCVMTMVLCRRVAISMAGTPGGSQHGPGLVQGHIHIVNSAARLLQLTVG